MSNYNMVEKVRKLLALSKSSNVHEAAAAAAVANKYIVQYRLSEADVNGSTSEEIPREPMYDDEEPIYQSARVNPWKLRLAQLLAHHYGCAIWNDRHQAVEPGTRGVSRFRLIGRYNDVKFAKYVFVWVVEQIQKHAEIECKGFGRTTFASYCNGAVFGVENMLAKSREQMIVAAERAGKFNAIKKMDNKEREAQEYMFEKYHLVHPAPKKPGFDPDAFERGYDVASHIGANIATPENE